MNNNYFINVLSDLDFGDMATGLLLGTRRTNPVANERAERFKQELRRVLVAEGHRAGLAMNTARALCELVGRQAVAQAALANDWRLILEQVFEVSTPLRGESSRPRRWGTPPLEVFELDITDVSPRAPFVVAPFGSEDGAYATWFLYEQTMMGGGVSRDGAKAALRQFSHHGKTFRALLAGRVQRVRCLPPLILFVSLQLFGEHAATAYPDWVRHDRRAAFTRAAKVFHQTIRGRFFAATRTSPQGSR